MSGEALDPLRRNRGYNHRPTAFEVLRVAIRAEERGGGSGGSWEAARLVWGER